MHLRSPGDRGSPMVGVLSQESIPSFLYFKSDIRYDYAYLLLTTLLFSITESRCIIRRPRQMYRILRFHANLTTPEVLVRQIRECGPRNKSVAHYPDANDPREIPPFPLRPRKFNRIGRFLLPPDDHRVSFFSCDYFLAPRFFATFRRPLRRVATGRH